MKAKKGLVQSAGKALKRASPTILACIGAVGVIATAILTAKATPKALKRIETAQKEKEAENGEKLTRMETIQACWQCYIPAAATGIATIGCIFGSNALNKRQQASLASAYALVSRSYRDYQRKVKEICGEDTHKQIVDALAAERVDPDHIIYTQGAFVSTCLDFPGAYEEEYLFYDRLADEHFTSTIGKVLQAEYHLNRMFAIQGNVSLTDYLNFMGIKKKIPNSDDIGWWVDFENEFYWIEFDHSAADLDDGPGREPVRCFVIDAPVLPGPPPPDY